MIQGAHMTTSSPAILTDYPGQELFSVSQAQKILCLSRATIWRMIARGQIDAVSVGDRRLIRRSSLAKIIECGCEIAA
jgi:excisionase family DNA binding protein